MKTIFNYITEKLKISKDSKSVDQYKVFGDGEVVKFKDCTFPFDDAFNKTKISEAIKILNNYIKPDDYVYFIKDKGLGFYNFDKLSKEFKEELIEHHKSIDNSEFIRDYEHDGFTIRINTIKKFHNFKDITQLEIYELLGNARMYFYIKI